ncbi:MAG: HRDC domain-containing protein [Candidatus Delongbacteria bacterium]|nr:HRDC domain-containing protein [Candidatus Delongbacteria bacterium]
MQLKIFTIPILNPEQFELEMNHFLSTHKVLEVKKEFSQSEKGVFWSFCVEYIENGVSNKPSSKKKSKIDYKTVLSEEHFKIFSKLREIRKEIADQEAIPAYAVFSDKELADISKLEAVTLSKIKTIEGIGEKKVEKYGQKFIDALKKKDSESSPE